MTITVVATVVKDEHESIKIILLDTVIIIVILNCQMNGLYIKCFHFMQQKQFFHFDNECDIHFVLHNLRLKSIPYCIMRLACFVFMHAIPDCGRAENLLFRITKGFSYN